MIIYYDSCKIVIAKYDWVFTRHIPNRSLWRYRTFPKVIYGTFVNVTVLDDCKSYFPVCPLPKGLGLQECDIHQSPIIPCHISPVTKYPICCSAYTLNSYTPQAINRAFKGRRVTYLQPNHPTLKTCTPPMSSYTLDSHTTHERDRVEIRVLGRSFLLP